MQTNQEHDFENELNDARILHKKSVHQLEQMHAQQRQWINLYQTKTDLLKYQHPADESIVDKLALGYTQLHWSLQLGSLSSVVLLTSMVGMLYSMTSLLGLLGCAIYLIGHYVLTDYSNKLLQREYRLQEEIKELELGINQSTEHMVAIERELKKVLVSLCTMNFEQASGVVDFRAQIETLALQINQMNALVESMGDANQSLVSDANTMTQLVDTYASMNQSLSKDAASLHQVNMDLSNTVSELTKDRHGLHEVIGQFSESHLQLEHLINHLSDTIKKIKTNNAIPLVDSSETMTWLAKIKDTNKKANNLLDSFDNNQPVHVALNKTSVLYFSEPLVKSDIFPEPSYSPPPVR